MKKFVIGFLLAAFSICVFLASLPVRADSAVPKDEEMEPYAYSNVLNVPWVMQTGDHDCWAACGSSICKYYKKPNSSKEQFAIQAGKDINEEASLQEMIPGFKKYGLNPRFVRDSLPFGSVQNIIRYESDPILADVTGHAVVIDGYSSDLSADPEKKDHVRYMEPDQRGGHFYMSYFELADPRGSGDPGPTAPNTNMRWIGTVYDF